MNANEEKIVEREAQEQLKALTRLQKESIVSVIRVLLNENQGVKKALSCKGEDLGVGHMMGMDVSTDEKLTDFATVAARRLNLSYGHVSALYDSQLHGSTQITIDHQANTLTVSLDARNRSDPYAAKAFVACAVSGTRQIATRVVGVGRDSVPVDEICATCSGFAGILLNTAQMSRTADGGVILKQYSRFPVVRIAWTYRMAQLINCKLNDESSLCIPSGLCDFAKGVFERVAVKSEEDFSWVKDLIPELKELVVEFIGGDMHGRRMSLSMQKPVMVGRGHMCEIYIPATPTTTIVSRRHFRLTREPGGIYAEDMMSCKGSFVNDIQLYPGERKRISNGDVVTLGGIHGVKFVIVSGADERKKTLGESRIEKAEPHGGENRVDSPNAGCSDGRSADLFKGEKTDTAIHELYDSERNRDAFPRVDYKAFERPYFSVFKKDGKIGVVESHSGTVVVNPVFEDIEVMQDRSGGLIDNVINVKDQGQWHLYRLGHGYPISPQFVYPGHLREGVWHAVYRGKLHGFVDGCGRIVLPFAFADAKSFSEGLCAVKWIPRDEYDGNDGWGYVDHAGKCIVRGQYLDACKFHGGFARVQGMDRDFEMWRVSMRLNGEDDSRFRAYWASSDWGIINRKGEEIMPCTNSLDVIHAELYRLRHPSSVAYNRQGYVASKDNVAIARKFVFVRDARDAVIALNLKGELLSECDGKEVGVGARVESWRDIRQVAAGFDHVVGLTSSGRLVSLGNTREFSNDTTIRSWRTIASVDACEGHVAAVRTDGHVEIATETGGYEYPENYSEELQAVSNARKIAVGWSHAAVLLADGTVKIVGKCYHDVERCTQWKELVDVDVFGCYFSPTQTVGLTSSGRVLHSLDVDEPDAWRDIVSVSCGDAFIVALDKFGKVYACGRNDHGQCDVARWPKMICVKGDFFTTVAIDAQGWIWMTPVGKTRHNVFGAKVVDGAVWKE